MSHGPLKRALLLVVALPPETLFGGCERFLRGLCRRAQPAFRVTWLGASYQFYRLVVVVYRFLGLRASPLAEESESPVDTEIERFNCLTLLPGTSYWRRARALCADAQTIYAKNEFLELLLVLLLGGRKAIRKTIVGFHTPIAIPDNFHGMWRVVHDLLYKNPVYRWIIQESRGVHGMTTGVLDDLKYVGLKSHRNLFIGFPLQFQRGSANSKPPKFVLAFAGRFTDQKGVDILVNVAELLEGSDIEIRVAGGGVENTLVEKAAARLRNFKYVGILPNVTDFFSEACAVLVPSRWETTGTVCAEAFISGVPPVAFDIPGNRDVFATAGCRDLLIPPFEIHAMVRKVLTLYGKWVDDREAYKRKYAGAGAGVRELFDPDRLFPKILDFLLQAPAQERRPGFVSR